MTQKQVQNELRRIGMSFKRNSCGEFRVNFKGGSEDSAYYTDDLHDALMTGFRMKPLHKAACQCNYCLLRKSESLSHIGEDHSSCCAFPEVDHV